jgi:hypothetical protein
MIQASSSHPRSAPRRTPVVPAYLATGLRPNATSVPLLGYFLTVGMALVIGLVALSARLEATTLPQASKNIRVASSSANLEKLPPPGSHLK